MSVIRVSLMLIAVASVCGGATSTALVVVRQYDKAESHSCAITIVAVDGHALNTPQLKVRLSPGRHVLLLRVRDLRGKLPEADAPLDTTFERHHYTVDGQLSRTGSFTLLFVDENKRPRGTIPPKMK